MADREVDQHLQRVAAAIRNHEGDALARLLSALAAPRCDWAPSPRAREFVLTLIANGTLGEACAGYGVGDKWGVIVAEQLSAAAALDADNSTRAYGHCVAAYNGLINQLRDEVRTLLSDGHRRRRRHAHGGGGGGGGGVERARCTRHRVVRCTRPLGATMITLDNLE